MSHLVKLPSSDEIMARLLAVDSNQHLKTKLYPLIAAKGGREFEPEGIALMVALAISDYTDGLPLIMHTLVTMRMKDFLAALIDDEEARKTAIAFCTVAQSCKPGRDVGRDENI